MCAPFSFLLGLNVVRENCVQELLLRLIPPIVGKGSARAKYFCIDTDQCVSLSFGKRGVFDRGSAETSNPASCRKLNENLDNAIGAGGVLGSVHLP
ncbi:hypothetical protein [Sphingomonas sp.]|uniref:hypothetical protein n=2 Tax=Sphingomonas TaxID=13687 RepID=UPI002584F471|nr:hypothetical protein [Sphingomonas sp.]